MSTWESGLHVPPYIRPWRAVTVAGLALLAIVPLLLIFAGLRARVRGLPDWALAVLDLVVLNLPLVLAVVIAGIVASSFGIAAATGIRSWRWIDLLYGLGVGLLARAIVESVSPTTGTLGGPFGAPPLGQVLVLVAGIVVISPFVEEWFFRGLVLRALKDALAGAGRAVASVTAIVVSAATFCALHFVPYGGATPVALLIGTLGVGIGCGILTVLTGRLGAAIFSHVVFNAVGAVLLIM